MKRESTYDVAIIGGGLAGLSTAILLRRKGLSVALLEKETYPFHKVCGEYLSLESIPFLESIGLKLSELSLPLIKKLMLTAPDGNSFSTKLPQGGVGLSRYLLDHRLSQLARSTGVELRESARVETVHKENDYVLGYSQNGEQNFLRAGFCCGAFGKKSNLDIKWNRDFLRKTDKRLDNYVAVKYHVRAGWDRDTIGLHNFQNGYCGISAIEEGLYCLCYMTKASMLKENGNSIEQLQSQVLQRNPALKKIFSSSEKLPSFPVTISQISFQSKSHHEKGIFMLGDAAGMITPLCGNGMSMALHSGKMAAASILEIINGRQDLQNALQAYEKAWKKEFGRRMKTGRLLQRFFGSTTLSNLFVQAFRTFPFLAAPLIRMTHGKPF